AAILDGRDFAREIRDELAVEFDEPQRREHLPPDALIDLDPRHQRMEDGRLLRQRRDHLPARLVRRIGRAFGLRKGVACKGPSRRGARAELEELSAIRNAEMMQSANAELAGAVCHDQSPFPHTAPSPAPPRPGKGTGVGFSASKFFSQKFIMTKYSCQSHC